MKKGDYVYGYNATNGIIYGSIILINDVVVIKDSREFKFQRDEVKSNINDMIEYLSGRIDKNDAEIKNMLILLKALTRPYGNY